MRPDWSMRVTPMPGNARLKAIACLCSALAIATSEANAAGGALCYRGINLSGGEYGDRHGVYGTDYIYPSDETILHFAHLGMNAVRLPIKWERLQPKLNAPLAEDELARLEDTVARIRRSGMTVILDPHNYAYYDRHRIGDGVVDAAALADFWARLAQAFGNRDGLVFGLMNEPHDLSAPDWLAAANQSIQAIRSTGARNLVLVPGTIWTGGATWFNDNPGGSNASVMLGVKDPADHYAFEFHQYMDVDYSGKHATCEKADEVRDALVKLSGWLRENGRRGFLGEFGGSSDPGCVKGIAGLTGVVADNSDVWIGWTYWAAGDWWPAEEPLNIQPRPGEKERPQLGALREAIGRGPADPDRCAPR